jgi:hypothetical protein
VTSRRPERERGSRRGSVDCSADRPPASRGSRRSATACRLRSPR